MITFNDLNRYLDPAILANGGAFPDVKVRHIYGRNPDVQSGTVPEDIWNAGGLYTGFPSQLETIQVFSSSANDTGAGSGARTFIVNGLDANYREITETFVLNGTTPVVSTQMFTRANMTRVITAGSDGSNAGTITVRHSTTTANIFSSTPIGTNHSHTAMYTVPEGYTGFLFCQSLGVRGAVSTSIDGHIMFQAYGEAAFDAQHFTASSGFQWRLANYGGLRIEPRTDIFWRISAVTGAAADVVCDYDMVLVRC